MTYPDKRASDLLRKQAGAKAIGPWLDRLSWALGRECSTQHMLSLDETDTMRAVFYERLRDKSITTSGNWPLEQGNALFGCLAAAGDAWKGIDLILFSCVDDTVGAVRAPGDLVLKNARAVWDVVGEDFRVASVEMANGLCLGVEYYTVTGRYVASGVYELAGWGAFSVWQTPQNA